MGRPRPYNLRFSGLIDNINNEIMLNIISLNDRLPSQPTQNVYASTDAGYNAETMCSWTSCRSSWTVTSHDYGFTLLVIQCDRALSSVDDYCNVKDIYYKVSRSCNHPPKGAVKLWTRNHRVLSNSVICIPVIIERVLSTAKPRLDDWMLASGKSCFRNMSIREPRTSGNWRARQSE